MVVAEGHGLRFAITDLVAQGLDRSAAREARLRAQVRQWAVDRVDIVQLREKQLESGEIFALALAAQGELARFGYPPNRPRLLVNGRPDLAAAAHADGVHLTSRVGELRPAQARQIFSKAGLPGCFVSVSCHTVGEVEAMRDAGADLILFGPVFEKRVHGQKVAAGTGMDALGQACRVAAPLPVLALGGITPENAGACLQHGAAGIAGIRLFAPATHKGPYTRAFKVSR